MINVLMFFLSQAVDGSPHLCAKDKANKTNHQQSPHIIYCCLLAEDFALAIAKVLKMPRKCDIIVNSEGANVLHQPDKLGSS
jgi:hypothetical protein